MDQRRRNLLMAGIGMGGAAFAAAQASVAFAAQPGLPRDMSNLEGFISVKSFGAAGDGAYDDTAAIEAAISAMKAGSCLYFPGGTYVISVGLSRLPKHSSVYCCEGAWLRRAPTARGISFFSVSGHNELVVNLMAMISSTGAGREVSALKATITNLPSMSESTIRAF